MGEGNLPTVFVNSEAETPTAEKWNNNYAYLNFVQDNLLVNGSFEKWSQGAALPPDGWNVATSPYTIARESSTVKHRSYSVDFTASPSLNNIYQSIEGVNFYKGKTVKLWCWVNCSTASLARIKVYDGVATTASAFHSGGGTWELLVITHEVSSSATELTVQLTLEAAGTAFFDACVLVDFADVLGYLGNSQSAQLPRNFIDGLEMENDSGDTQHDIKINAGACIDFTNNYYLSIDSSLTKQIDVNYAPGDAAGGFPSGLSLLPDIWYYVFLIKNLSTGAIDAGYDTSLTADNLLADATGYTAYRRLGSVLTDGSSNILNFIQEGDNFYWVAASTDRNLSLSSVTYPTTTTVQVPTGVKTIAFLNAKITGNSNLEYNITPTSINDPTQSVLGSAASDVDVARVEILADTSGQVSDGLNVYNSGSVTLLLRTIWYEDFRGKNG